VTRVSAQAGSVEPSTRDLLALYRPDLERTIADSGHPGYRYAQAYQHLMRRPGSPLSEATNLPSDLREALDPLGHSTLVEHRKWEDADGTTKSLLAARDGALIEAVVMRYEQRSTACLSSQVGCSLGCTFCSTGAMGFVRDLTAAEIVDQVRHLQALLAPEGRSISNIVFMGMGEPLLNLDAVLAAIRLLKDPEGMAFAQRALSVSTIGIPSGIRRLAHEEPQVNLAISLHAADDKLRTQLVPANRRFALSEVLAAADDHFTITRRKLFVEYVLLGGVNDSTRHAVALADLLRGRVVTVNLIPCNPVRGGFEPPPAEVAAAFRDTLVQRGLTATLRTGRGRAILAGCGQLATKTQAARKGIRNRGPDR